MSEIISRLKKDKVGLVGVIGVLLVLVMGFIGPLVTPHDPTEMYKSHTLEGPSATHWFGTDDFGRDIFSRVMQGARVSLYVGLISVGIGATLGFLFGLIAGFFQGWVDNVIMRIMDILFAFPDILLALTIVAVLGPSLRNTMVAIGIVFTPVFTRTVRAAVISVKEMEFITSARSIGVKTHKVIFKHVSPNILAPFIVQITLALSGAILTEAALSFLGLGIQPPEPSWGSMLNASRQYMEIAPWIAIFPAIFIIITIFCFNLLGDSLRDILDPKLNQ
ncbi:ABC transporter permease [Pontibacillus yanchengensis]|uniref:Glutathione ABC transporter permease n=1 Tax=Pontibacillus yanchengensis Y32 TaxID=1385514 RepID=A0A0A2TJM5_9BACI|nr:ABC transporter permease [Pontibacillus yanchengensis]KGP74643.1 glutathione ABC transporter permease [Pontibacillus yanchengensis Y32]